jgi:catalase
MAGHGIPRSFRHVDGFGVHTFRMVTDKGASKLVKFHWKGMQGKASFVWEEAQQAAGKNADFMRQDLFEAIEAGRFPEWEVCTLHRLLRQFIQLMLFVARCSNHG